MSTDMAPNSIGTQPQLPPMAEVLDAGAEPGESPGVKSGKLHPNISSPLRRRRMSGDIPTRSAAVRSFCYECLGWEPDGHGGMAAVVRSCTCRECHLWPYRNGPLDQRGLAEEVTP
jgi:hypothetical protein